MRSPRKDSWRALRTVGFESDPLSRLCVELASSLHSIVSNGGTAVTRQPHRSFCNDAHSSGMPALRIAAMARSRNAIKMGTFAVTRSRYALYCLTVVNGAPGSAAYR